MLDLGSQTNIFFWHLHSTQPPTSTPNGKQGMRNALLYLSERDCNVSALLTCAEETSADQSQDCYKSPPQKHSQHNAKPFSPLPYSPQQLDTSPQQPYSSMMIDSTPPGMDRDAYIAGERAAITRSLQMMLPSQQQLGALSSGLQKLEYMVSEEATRARHMQSATVELSTVAQNLTERLDRIERTQLPEIETRMQRALDAPLSQEFQATLTGLTSAVQQSAHQRYLTNGPSFTGFIIQQLGWLGSAAVLYTQKALSKADIAALFLSRKILLDEKAQVSGTLESSNGHSESQFQVSSSGLEHKLKSVGGASLFLVAVEIAWQLQSRAIGVVPKQLRRAVYPARLGLRVLRIATWVASLLISTVLFRRGCYVLADSGVARLKGFLQWCRSFKPFSSPATRLQNLQISGDAEIGEGSEIGATSPSSKVPDEGSPEKPKMPYSEVIRLQAASQSGGPIPHPQPLQRVRSIFDTPPPSPQ